jgi:putative protease
MTVDMRIISPVDNFQEAGLLLEAGADELYGGYIPAGWNDYSLSASLNQRTFSAAQIASEKELAEIIALVHGYERTFALTLNAPFYTNEQLPLLIEYLDRMVILGIDSLILADPGLLRLLKKRHGHLEYHASTLAHLTNSGAVRFMAEQGIQRVVLPRHLGVSDMTSIIQQAPGVLCDAFLLVGKCPNSEGLCTFHHSSPEKIWPCEVPYEINPLAGGASSQLQQAIQKQNSWSETNRRHGCGLCAIPALQKAGVHGLKLVGRGAPAAQKVRNVTLTREFLDLAGSITDFAKYRQKAMAAHRERFGAVCHQNVCYYPEFFDGPEFLEGPELFDGGAA